MADVKEEDRVPTATVRPPATATNLPTTSTVTLQLEPTTQQEVEGPRLVLRLKKAQKKGKKVGFTTETVDNETMNKKKSKCCCIYKKPRMFGESSSESEDECEDCHGHHGQDLHPPPPPPPTAPPLS